VDEATLTDAALLIGLSQFDEAERVLERVLTDADERGDDAAAGRALEGLGTVATRRGQELVALGLFERAIERSGRPDPAERESLYTNAARLRSMSGNAGGAVELLEDCLRRVRGSDEPDAAIAAHFAITLSYAYSDAGEYGKAGTVLAGVLQDGGEDLDLRVRQRLYYALTRLNINTGRTDLAVEYARRMVELTESAGLEDIMFEALHQCAHALLDAHDPELAGAYLERAEGHAQGPVDEGFLRVEQARQSLQLGDYEAALERAGEAIDLLADRSVPGELGRAYLIRARVYDDTGEDGRADTAYLMAIDALEHQTGWPTEMAKAYRRYGKFLRRQGRTEAALRMLELAGDAGL
jgi:tetratricopeptide (TPR) repeat protein